MRFRLATSGTGGGGQDLAGGVGNLFRSIAMAPAMAAQASIEAQDAQAVRDLRGAQMRAADAQSALYGQQAQEIEDQRQRGTIGGQLQTGMFMHGVPMHLQKDFGNYLQTGQMPGQYTPAPDDMGPVLPKPGIYSDDTGQKILKTLGLTNQALTVGDSSVSSIARAEQMYRDIGLGDRIIAGEVDPTRVSQARFATTGGPSPFEFKEFGTGNQVTGQLDETTGAATRFGQVRQSEIRKNDASAANNYASRDKTRQEIEALQGNAVADAGGPNQVALTKQYGKASPGYRWKADGTQEAIPGGPADIKAGEAGAKSQARADAAALAAGNVLTAVTEARGLVGPTTAGLGSPLANVPGFNARDLRAKLDTIKANLGFDRLQQMREMSPTGGALGAVAVQELIALQSTVASLDQAQSPAELKKSLDRIELHYRRWLKTVSDGAPTVPAGVNLQPAGRQGGASGSWDEPAAGGWSIQRVN